MGNNTYVTNLTIINKERTIKNITMMFWILVFLLSGALALYTYLSFTRHIQTRNVGIGYYVLSGFGGLISLFYIGKTFIKLSGWKRAIKTMAQSDSKLNSPSTTLFLELYKGLVIKRVRTFWFMMFLFTYFGLFTLIVFLLKDLILEIGSQFEKTKDGNVQNGFQFYMVVDFKTRLKNAFGNVNLMLAINLGILIGSLAMFLFMTLQDGRRLQDVKMALGNEPAIIEMFKITEEKRKTENILWIKIYLLSIGLFIILPIILILWGFYRRVIRGKKGK